jgi:hypothetical protein
VCDTFTEFSFLDEKAAEAYMAAVGCYLKLNKQIEVADNYAEAGDCFEKSRKNKGKDRTD